MKLSEVKPNTVWQYFEQLTQQVPRRSQHKEKVIAFMLDFAKKHNLEVKKDKTGNILIKKPAAKGMENVKSIILQAHLDMVCVADKDVKIDFLNDPIPAYVDGEWVKAKGTTLGADNAIGMAMMMRILTDNQIQHGPIECLFTVDEEIGLIGAHALESGFFESKILINLDSEKEGEIFVGCAGGIDAKAFFDYHQEAVPANHVAYQFAINKLKGGHSGADIYEGRANANKIANRFLYYITEKYQARLSEFSGGHAPNVIASSADFIFTIDQDYQNELKSDFEAFANEIKSEFIKLESSMNIDLKAVEKPDFVINMETQKNLTNALYICPNGVFAMSLDIPGLVETSTNLAVVKFREDDLASPRYKQLLKQIIVLTKQRSSIASGKCDINTMVRKAFELNGAKVSNGAEYPGWKPNLESELLKVAEDAYFKLFGKKPLVKASHGGLECGLFLEKYNRELDMISIGPTIKDAHSINEKIEIRTVQMCYEHILEILKNIPKNS